MTWTRLAMPGGVQGRAKTRRTRALGVGRDDVDRAGGERHVGLLGGRAEEHDRGRARGHDPLDDLEAAGMQGEVEQDGVRAGGADEGHGLLGGLRSAEHLDAGHLQEMAEACETHMGAGDDDGRDPAFRDDRRADVGRGHRHATPSRCAASWNRVIPVF